MLGRWTVLTERNGTWCVARSQTPRLEHQNDLPVQPRLTQQHQRNAGGLAGTGWCFKHRFVTFAQRLAQGWQGLVDRQGDHGDSAFRAAIITALGPAERHLYRRYLARPNRAPGLAV